MCWKVLYHHRSIREERKWTSHSRGNTAKSCGRNFSRWGWWDVGVFWGEIIKMYLLFRGCPWEKLRRGGQIGEWNTSRAERRRIRLRFGPAKQCIATSAWISVLPLVSEYRWKMGEVQKKGARKKHLFPIFLWHNDKWKNETSTPTNE